MNQNTLMSILRVLLSNKFEFLLLNWFLRLLVISYCFISLCYFISVRLFSPSWVGPSGGNLLGELFQGWGLIDLELAIQIAS